jgi:hypothetical protein
MSQSILLCYNWQIASHRMTDKQLANTQHEETLCNIKNLRKLMILIVICWECMCLSRCTWVQGPYSLHLIIQAVHIGDCS